MAVLCRSSLLALLLLLPGLAARADSPQPAPSDPAVPMEQAHLDAVSSRYSVEVPDDEHLPLSLRKSEAPRGTNLINLSW